MSELFGLKSIDLKQLMNVSYLKALKKHYRILLMQVNYQICCLQPPGIGKTTAAKHYVNN